MDCTNCTYDQQCRTTDACKPTSFDREAVVAQYTQNKEIVQAAAALVDYGRAGTLSRLQEVIDFSKQMKYQRIGLAYCYGMEPQVKQIASLLRANELKVRSVSCTVGGIEQNVVNPESTYCSVSCNPIGQARQLNQEGLDLVLVIGLCLGHDILFQREIKVDCTTLVVKDRVYNHAPLNVLSEN